MIYWGAGTSYLDHFLSALPEETERGYYALLGWLATAVLLGYVGVVAAYEASYDLLATRVEAEVISVSSPGGEDSDRRVVAFVFTDVDDENRSIHGRGEISLATFDGPVPERGGRVAVEYFPSDPDSARTVTGRRRSEVYLFWAAAAVGSVLLAILIAYANREVNRPFHGPPAYMR